ncbi:MAG: DNA repair protein RecO [Clostridia bacterium]|nr:DNA repair protein RecO [Clostridia bacterium]
MQHFSTDALILRAVDRGDNDRLLTVLAANYGRFYAILKGAHSMRRREAAAAEPFTWSNFEFYERGGVKWVKSATAQETFPGIRYDMDKLFLAAYVAEVAAELSDEREPAGEILPLALNTLHKLSVTKGENEMLKAAFELRAACIAGFAPELHSCHSCHALITGENYLDVMNGALICADCLHRSAALAPLPEFNDLGERTVLVPLTAAAAAALCYVASAPARRVFSFQLTDEASKHAFCRATEAYLLHHLERSFPSLEQYKKTRAMLARIQPNAAKAADEESC